MTTHTESAMLVVTANWCVSDGSLAAGAPRAHVERFRAELRKASLRSGVRRDGRYHPVDAIDVVLAGDTFDWLVSREWTGDLRPWHSGRKADAARARVVVDALRRGERLLATLAAWMRRGIVVPDADRRGRPMSTVSRTVPVRVTVLRGDRDRWLEQAAHAWSRTGEPAPVAGTCWSDGEVTIRHGDEMDPLHASGCEPTVGESLAVDLIARFGVAIHDIATVRPLAGALVRSMALGTAVDAPRKLARTIESLLVAGTISESIGARLHDAWRRSVALWHQSARRLSLCGEDGVDMVGRIAEWLHDEQAPTSDGPTRWIDPFPAPSIPFPWDSTPYVVLGHHAADADGTTAGRQPVWLGARHLRSGERLHDDRESPAVVVVQPDRLGRRFEWLPIEFGADVAARRSDDGSGRGVWRSPPSWSGGIVDAA